LGAADPVGHERLRAEMCYPTYARRSGSVGGEEHEDIDPELEAAIQEHLGARRVSRAALRQRGPDQRLKLGPDMTARGCLISVGADGQVHPCDEAHACSGFDCSFMWAFVATLTVIQAIRPLPAMDVLLNAGDLTLETSARGPGGGDGADLPVFTRTGTRWTNTIAIPFEWQLHPAQNDHHLRRVVGAAANNPWHVRHAQLVWRGSASNCRFAACQPSLAAQGDEAAMAACARPPVPGALWDCTWDLGSWLRMPRGRLVWATRMYPKGIDARFVRSEHLSMDPGLEAFLEDEGLIGERMQEIDQVQYKYAISVEGDSAPDRLYWQLFSGSVVLVPDGPWQVFAAHTLLRPYVHFVPLRYDLSDLVDKVTWLQAHDEEAQAIAENAARFARRYFTHDGIVYFVDRLLRAYAERLTD